MSSAVVLWDLKEEPLPGAVGVWCWQSYCCGDGVVSIPRYLEEHAERIRGRYLAFVHELGQCRIASRRIVDHLDLGDGFSYWWLTQVAEKSPFKSPGIYDCLRLLCLEELLLAQAPSQLTLVSSSRVLARAVDRLCAHLSIGFRFEPKPRPPKAQRSATRRIYEAMPYLLQGVLSLRHVVRRWPLRRALPRQWFSGESALFICSYFIHLDPSLCLQGQFHSRQWEGLPRAVQERGGRINWLQLFLLSAVVPNLRRGLDWVAQFNADAHRQGCHAFLDSYLTVTRLVAALAIWLRLTLIAWRLRNVSAAFYPSGSGAWMWPFLRHDWQSSLAGPVALANCLAVVLFDSALADMPPQKMGLYLCENQAWEKALLRAWRRHGHGEIVGVQHATAPFWHLYYFDDRRSFTSSASNSLPLPDHLAVNGTDARRAFAAAGFPLERVVEVEALRYLQLADTAGRSSPRKARQLPRRVLIVGDIVPGSIHHLLGLLQEAARLLPSEYAFTFKSHPGLAVDLAAYPELRAMETREALSRILGDHDVAVAANSTSAAVDAFVAGVPVIIAVDGDSLNLSPLRGRAGVRFVSTVAELAQSLQTTTAGASPGERADFFFLDPELPRWEHLLAPVVRQSTRPHAATANTGGELWARLP